MASVDNCLFSVKYNSWDEEIGLQLFNKEKLGVQRDNEEIESVNDLIGGGMG